MWLGIHFPVSCWAQCCSAALLTRRGWSGVTRPPDGWGWSVCWSLCIYRAVLAAAIGLSSGALGVSLVCLITVGICGQRGAGLYVMWHGPGLQWISRVCSLLAQHLLQPDRCPGTILYSAIKFASWVHSTGFLDTSEAKIGDCETL